MKKLVQTIAGILFVFGMVTSLISNFILGFMSYQDDTGLKLRADRLMANSTNYFAFGIALWIIVESFPD